jgi:carbon storage regulator
MLVLARKVQESVVVGGSNASQPVLVITVLEIEAGRVRLGFQADLGVPIHREEVWQRIANERPDSATPGPAPDSG